MSLTHRTVFTKLRCGVAPIRLGTGRYGYFPIENRICPVRKTSIENENRVLI